MKLLRAKIMGMARPARWNGPGSRAIRKSACGAAIDFVHAVERQTVGIPLPRVGPSQLGGIALQWRFGNVHYMIRVASDDPDHLYFQREGPGFKHDSGTISRDRAIADMVALARGAGVRKS